MYNLRKFREAKAILPHLEIILRILYLTEKSLSTYRCYIPVMRILNVIDEQSRVLEAYRKVYKKEKDTKGKIE